jgi:hypothetical protein
MHIANLPLPIHGGQTTTGNRTECHLGLGACRGHKDFWICDYSGMNARGDYMNRWTDDELNRIGKAEELQIASLRS